MLKKKRNIIMNGQKIKKNVYLEKKLEIIV